MSRLRVVATAVVVLALAGGVAVTLVVVQRAQPRPHEVRTGPTMVPSTAGYHLTGGVQLGAITLNDVSCTSPAACTVVGYSTTHHRDTPLAARWNGLAWAMQPAPAPPAGGQLEAVSCTTATACTAVGEAYRKPVPGEDTQPLAESWNGTRWAVQSAAAPVKGAYLSDVSCISPTACMAMMGFQARAQTLMERWDGRTWVLLGTPPASMTSLSCLSAAWCQAAGSDLPQDFGTWSQDWNGSFWAAQATPSTERGPKEETVSAVSCASPTACIAVGSDFYNSYDLTAERWDGTQWTDVSPGNPPGTGSMSELGDVSCPTTTFCMAVGGFTDGQDRWHTAAVRWNGSHWTHLPAGEFPGKDADLSNLDCPSPTFCLAVGTTYTDTKTWPLVEKWNGVTWATQAAPSRL